MSYVETGGWCTWPVCFTVLTWRIALAACTTFYRARGVRARRGAYVRVELYLRVPRADRMGVNTPCHTCRMTRSIDGLQSIAMPTRYIVSLDLLGSSVQCERWLAVEPICAVIHSPT